MNTEDRVHPAVAASPEKIQDHLAACAGDGVQAPDEQAAFEGWLHTTRPSGDAESVQYQWSQSSEYSDLLADSAAPQPPAGQQDRGEDDPLDTAELVSDDRLMWQWNRKDACLHGKSAVIWFARAAINDYRAAIAGEATAAVQGVERFIGESETADFEADTWTFKMMPGYKVGAGFYRIEYVGLTVPAAPANGEGV